MGFNCETGGKKGGIEQAYLNEAEVGSESHIFHGFGGHDEEAGLDSIRYEEMF